MFLLYFWRIIDFWVCHKAFFNSLLIFGGTIRQKLYYCSSFRIKEHCRIIQMFYAGSMKLFLLCVYTGVGVEWIEIRSVPLVYIFGVARGFRASLGFIFWLDQFIPLKLLVFFSWEKLSKISLLVSVGLDINLTKSKLRPLFSKK